MDTPENPKRDPARLAAVHWFPRHLRRQAAGDVAIETCFREMCDAHSYTTHIVKGRVYRHLYLAVDPIALVDEWDIPYVNATPIGVAFSTTAHLLRWAGATAVDGEVLECGRAELHGHVRRMDEYLKHRLPIEQSHEGQLDTEETHEASNIH